MIKKRTIYRRGKSISVGPSAHLTNSQLYPKCETPPSGEKEVHLNFFIIARLSINFEMSARPLALAFRQQIQKIYK